VFELAQGSGTNITLASFNRTNGDYPLDALIMDKSGNLYGTASDGGAWNHGTVFELVHGRGTITLLASFNPEKPDGVDPKAGLIMDSSGNLYGTTSSGGAGGLGMVFELQGAAAQASFRISGFPSSATAGTSQASAVTIQNADGTADTASAGTVHLKIRDPTAELPANDTFKASDEGTPLLSALVLQKKGNPSITTTERLFSSIMGSLVVDCS
jgi:uncharacterized repeat protein (TIGR03803 family)